MEAGESVEFLEVKVVRASDLGLCCHIGGRDHWIARDRVLSGSSVADFGDLGTLVLARQFAEDRGLLLHQLRAGA